MHRIRTINWIRLLLDFYYKRKEVIIDETILTPSEELFILSILYLFRVSDIERLVDTLFNGREILLESNTPHEFYKIVDHIRTEFADFFKDLIINRNFSDEEYINLAKEYLMLDEQVSKQIRIPLLDQLKKLTREGNYAREDGRPFNDEEKILRLWKFFTAVELFEKDRKEEILGEAKEYLKEKATLVIPQSSDNIQDFQNIFFENLKGLLCKYIEPSGVAKENR